MSQREGTAPDDGTNPYEGLRQMALGAVAAGLASPGPEHPDVWGVVIDIPRGADGVTIVALGDGTTSMYTSVGGGTLGLGAHEPVRQAAEQLLEVIQVELLPFLEPDPGTHPPPSHVRFHVLGADGLTGIDVPDAVFWGEPGGGGNLVDATQQLIQAIGSASPPPG